MGKLYHFRIFILFLLIFVCDRITCSSSSNLPIDESKRNEYQIGSTLPSHERNLAKQRGFELVEDELPASSSSSGGPAATESSHKEGDGEHREIRRYPVASVEFTRVETPFIIGLWIFCARDTVLLPSVSRAGRADEAGGEHDGGATATRRGRAQARAAVAERTAEDGVGEHVAKRIGDAALEQAAAHEGDGAEE